MGCAASLSARYLPALPLPKLEGDSQASTAPKAAETPETPKKWTRTEMGQLTVPQLVRWAESLRLDLESAVSNTARERLWEEIEKSRPPALEQVSSHDVEHWPLPETLRWLEYFEALDESVAPKDKLMALLLAHSEEGGDLTPPAGESAEANFLTEVQRHVGMVKQAAATIMAQLSEQLTELEAQERKKHPWFANGKALTEFKPSELKGAEEMNIPFIELNAGEEVDLTVHPSGWAWAVLGSRHGWVPSSSVTETARALQEYSAEEEESMGCREGDEFEVIMRHYSGWTLCRRPKVAGEGSDGSPSRAADEGWLPDNCLSDHPRNTAIKQQQLILAGLQRLSVDVNGVEATLYRIQTEGAAEDDSLQSLHAKVCELAEEYRKIVAVLQANPQLLAQEEQAEPAAEETVSGAPVGLPPWVSVNNHCYYVSKTQKKLMSVTIQRVCEVRKQILVTFDTDRNARKIVGFDAFEDMATCPLQPKAKRTRKGRKRHAKNAVDEQQNELADELQGLMQALGPTEQISDAVSETESSSYDSSDYTTSTGSGEFDRHASGPSAEQESGSTMSVVQPAEAAEAEAKEKAARQIQAAYRRFQRTLTFSKEPRREEPQQELPRPPAAPLAPERRHGAVSLVQSVIKSYMAKELLQRMGLEAQVREQQHRAVLVIASVAQRFLVQVDLMNWRQLLRSCQHWQGALRSFQARQQLQQLQLAEFRLRSAAALRLQTAARGCSARRELARRRAKREGLLLLSPSKHRSVRLLQRSCRRFLAQLALREALQQQHRMALRIQAAWRGRSSRKQMAQEWEQWHKTRYQAASRLQSMVKAVDARKQLRRSTLARSAAAQWIQTSWRGHQARRRVTPLIRRRQQAAQRIQGLRRMANAQRKLQTLREERQQREDASATKIQSAMRSRRVRQQVQPLIQERRDKEHASVKVQSSWRRQLAKQEALRRRADVVDGLLTSLLQGASDGEPRGQMWLEKVSAALEWKAQRDEEVEEKQLRLRRQNAPQQSKEELVTPEGLRTFAVLDRSMVASRLAFRRRQHRVRALLETQCRGAEELCFAREVCQALALDHGVLIRLDITDGVAEVAHVLQTAWSIAFQLRTAEGVGGANPAMQLLISGARSLKRRLQMEARGKASGAEEGLALKGFLEFSQESSEEAAARAQQAREAVLRPLKEELTSALAGSQDALKELNASMAKVRPEVEAIRSKHKVDAAEAEAKLREEREQKHAQTVALNKIAIRTQIEKERLEAGLADKNRPKIACYKKVFANVKDLQQELKVLEVSGTANRKSQGILQHTLRALESRAAKAETDSRSKAIFGEAEEDLKDFQPSDKVEKKMERGEEQELQFREALESEVKSLHADMDARSNFEAGMLGAQLRAEAEAVGEAALACEEQLRSWKARCDPLRQWLAEVVPMARSCEQIRAAAEFLKVCFGAEGPHSAAAAIRAVQKQLGEVESQAEKAQAKAESPREGQLPQVLSKLQNALKALNELRVSFPDMPRSPMRSPNGPGRKLYGREEDTEGEDDAPKADEVAKSPPPPFPPPDKESPKPAAKSAARPAGLTTGGLSIAGLAELGQNLSALSSLQPPTSSKSPMSPLSPARPSSAASPGGKAERSDKVSAPLRDARPSSASTRMTRPAASAGSATKAVQKARAVASGWE